jgi:Cu2+-containing amine oxidase
VSTVPPAASHPLDPLTADEIRTAVAVLREAQDLGEARFPLITTGRDVSRSFAGQMCDERPC